MKREFSRWLEFIFSLILDTGETKTVRIEFFDSLFQGDQNFKRSNGEFDKAVLKFCTIKQLFKKRTVLSLDKTLKKLDVAKNIICPTKFRVHVEQLHKSSANH